MITYKILETSGLEDFNYVGNPKDLVWFDLKDLSDVERISQALQQKDKYNVSINTGSVSDREVKRQTDLYVSLIKVVELYGGSTDSRSFLRRLKRQVSKFGDDYKEEKDFTTEKYVGILA